MAKRVLGTAAIAATTAMLVVPSVAGARAGDRTFAQTYPVASHLCTEVAAGKRPRLKKVAATVLADCAALQANFTAAQTAVLATRASIASQVAADAALIKAACPQSQVGKPACENARHSENAAISSLHAQGRAAARLYYKTIEANRHTFWHAIHLLLGASHLPADKPIKVENS